MVKIFLHVSKEEQQKRLIDRIFNQEKNWKFSMGDIHEREHWDEYRELYEELLENTSKDRSPWYIVPADNKWFTRYVVALITLDVLKKIDPKFPKLSPEEQKQLERFRDMIKKETDKPLEEIRKENGKEIYLQRRFWETLRKISICRCWRTRIYTFVQKDGADGCAPSYLRD